MDSKELDDVYIFKFKFIYLVFQKYRKFSDHDMDKVLKLEMKGDVEKCFQTIGM